MRISGRRAAIGNGQSGWQTKIVPVLTFNRVEVYLACNLAVPAALVDKINAAMEAMVATAPSNASTRSTKNGRAAALAQ
ncbi:hypothetical protein CR105_04185 [Massilia eurypsychrophila]|uniref:Uncharacterized protein n=1 Tax=Massilia eurypsychrophila TaxID=1485217 RepID=A0A2G8TJS8_9BURK|nr:hypothetical protein [Massilia eurypsychrophila]PIL46293.1 hypothetical protein CR105_04185 [Massilia eurypsychrophila]